MSASAAAPAQAANFNDALGILNAVTDDERNWRGALAKLPELFAEAKRAQGILQEFQNEEDAVRRSITAAQHELVLLSDRVANAQGIVSRNEELAKESAAALADAQAQHAAKLAELAAQSAAKEVELERINDALGAARLRLGLK